MTAVFVAAFAPPASYAHYVRFVNPSGTLNNNNANNANACAPPIVCNASIKVNCFCG